MRAAATWSGSLRRNVRRGAHLALLAAAAAPALAQEVPPERRESPREPRAAQQPAVPAGSPGETFVLRRISIATADVFSSDQAAENPLFALANVLHGTTQEAVVAREVWLAPGDPIRVEEAAEIARNLRALGLFGAVSSKLVPVGDGEADLEIATRDRFSLGASANVGRVGGVDKLGFTLTESNLFGTGKAIGVRGSATRDEEGYEVFYRDPQLLGSRHTMGVTVGETDEGAYGSFTLARPFRRLEDPYEYGLAVATADRDVDYYRFGESVAEVPAAEAGTRLYGAVANGPRELRTALGVELRLRRAEYGAPFGPLAGAVRRPIDHEEMELGPYWTLDWRPRFVIVRRLDSLDFDEDVPLGIHVGARTAARWRDEEGVGAEIDPVAGFDVRAAAQPFDRAFATVQIDADVALYDGALQSHRVSGALHAYWLGLPAQTLAASFTWETIGEERDLQPQLTLGEDNGLRGYPAREFAGTTIARLNLEDRIDTGIQAFSVRLGLAAFLDAGFVHDPVLGLAMDEPLRSVGIGLRLGSSHLLGSRIVRIDVAWPLDDPFDEDYGASVSISIGQVFSLFGNASSLVREF